MTADACTHAVTRRGPDIPRAWGSYRSEICTACGSYRYRLHGGKHGRSVAGERGRWRPASELEADINSEES